MNTCNSWLADCDADGFPRSNTAVINRCGPTAPAGIPQGCPAGGRFVLRDSQGRVDCCDASAFVNHAQTQSSADFSLSAVCPSTWKNHDFDCDGVVRYRSDLRLSPVGSESCNDASAPGIPCAQRSSIGPLGANSPFGYTPTNIFDADGDATECGNSSLQWQTCRLVNGTCTATLALAPPCD